jgi:hypothetical protein
VNHNKTEARLASPKRPYVMHKAEKRKRNQIRVEENCHEWNTTEGYINKKKRRQKEGVKNKPASS